jgi:hypothetical protein
VCRNIKPLFNFEPPATEEEIRASALQFVRKVSGMNAPSRQNARAFEDAVARITEITRTLVLDELATSASPRTRERAAAEAKARAVKREAQLRRRYGSG